MRHFSSDKNRLRSLAVRVRLIYAVFLLLSLLALVSATLLYCDGPGWRLSSIERYYRGGSDAYREQLGTETSPPSTRTGPDVSLPEVDPTNERRQPSDSRIAYPRSYRQLLESAHQHLFMMPVMLLVLAHLFAMTGLVRVWVNGTIAISTLGIAGHVAGPWLVRYAGGLWAWIPPVTMVAMLLGLGVMIGASFWALCRSTRRGTRTA